MFRRSSGEDLEPDVDERLEDQPSADDELLRRLQNMEWPKAPPELRERCWREISKRIAEMEAQGIGPGAARPAGSGNPGADPGSGLDDPGLDESDLDGPALDEFDLEALDFDESDLDDEFDLDELDPEDELDPDEPAPK